MSEYEGALVGTDMTRPEFQSLRINPAYKAWEEEKMDPYSGPDGVSFYMSQNDVSGI